MHATAFRNDPSGSGGEAGETPQISIGTCSMSRTRRMALGDAECAPRCCLPVHPGTVWFSADRTRRLMPLVPVGSTFCR